MQFLRITKWDEYQHYKDRDPPWIKLHKKMLSSRVWIKTDDAAKLLAIALMLVAAEKGNRIDADPEYIKDLCRLKQTPDFAPLIALEFIELIDENGAVIAERKHGLPKCASETETYRSETEKKEAPQSAAAPKRNDRGGRLPLDWKATEAQRQFARDCGLDPDRTETIFKNFWHAKSGKDACKLDWDKTWQNWCLRDAKPVTNATVTQMAPEDRQKARLDSIASCVVKGFTNNLSATDADLAQLVAAGRITEDQARMAGWSGPRRVA